ncbi:hypothetical protein P280DRAFT_231268 [Massarina eburnea CBS 473.64]|uniref:Uncharacterized protein n=1 Tax=Massarina eburnea CBS 473.64 TaxID=1395130 RepID=A0A6A6S9E3_9PLEO|nr:hypothetical protein P280DRAFT_231268 [Massarina eburnea CBS 473.64]
MPWSRRVFRDTRSSAAKGSQCCRRRRRRRRRRWRGLCHGIWVGSESDTYHPIRSSAMAPSERIGRKDAVLVSIWHELRARNIACMIGSLAIGISLHRASGYVCVCVRRLGRP